MPNMVVCRFCNSRVHDKSISCPTCGAVLDLVRHAEEASKPGSGLALRPTETRPATDPNAPREDTSTVPGQRPRDVRISPDTERQLAELAARGEIIQAVKIYRRLTGASLSEAKDFIDSFPKPAGTGGCASGCLRGLFGCFAIIVVVFVALVAIAMFLG